MNNFIEGCANRFRVCITILIMILVFGMISYKKIPKESAPDVKVPIIYVSVRYDGVSPEDCERLIGRPLENSFRSIVGIKQITTYANEGSASIVMEFDAGFDSNKALQDVRAQVQDVYNELPQDAKYPTVHEINLSLEPVLSVVISGDVDERVLIGIARDLKDELEGINGVLEVNIAGDREDALEIIIDRAALEQYGISLSAVAAVLDSNNKIIPAGSISTRNGDYTIKVPSLISNREQLLDFPIKTNGSAVVKLKDLATVRSGYKDRVNYARVNGKPALVLEVSKRIGSSIISVVENVKAVLIKASDKLPSKISISYTQDRSEKILEMIAELENGLILAIILVMIIIILSVGVKQSVIISLSIPISFFCGILLLDISGLTLNVVVLFSLILTVGMIVDDAIVVSEYADRKMIEGVEPKEAFIIAAKRMFLPIVTSTLVKIVVFLPLLFWPGVIGQFMKYMPITVVAILSSSLLFALFMQPAIGPLFGKHEESDPETIRSMLASEEGKVEHLTGFVKSYIILLEKVLQRPKMFIFCILGSMIFVYWFFGVFGPGKEFFPKVDPESAILIIRSPGNLSVEQKDTLVREVENKVQGLKEVRVQYVKSGDFSRDSKTPQDTIGTVQLVFIDWKERRKVDAILKEVLAMVKDIKGISIETSQERMGPPSPKPIEFDITGDDYLVITKAAELLKDKMSAIEGLKDIETSLAADSIEWQVLVDRAEAAKYGVDMGAIGQTIRMITNGLVVSTFRPDYLIDEVDIQIKMTDEFRSIQALKQLKIVNRDGDAVPLSNFAKVIPGQKVTGIKRVDLKKVVTIRSDVMPGVLVERKVAEIRELISSLKDELGPVYSIFRGDEKDQGETMVFLMNAFAFSLVGMFIIMLIQFNSFYHSIIIMSAVFLSTVGVLLGLIISWQPFGIVMCGVGVIALAGIVLNNNILFIDTYQHLRRTGVDQYTCILMAGAQRLRPILLTALAAILGLMPMVLTLTVDFYKSEITHGAPSSALWSQLAASIAGGLTFATVLTLFFTPCLLLVGRKLDIKIDKVNTHHES